VRARGRPPFFRPPPPSDVRPFTPTFAFGFELPPPSQPPSLPSPSSSSSSDESWDFAAALAIAAAFRSDIESGGWLTCGHANRRMAKTRSYPQLAVTVEGRNLTLGWEPGRIGSEVEGMTRVVCRKYTKALSANARGAPRWSRRIRQL
jgi:hypothetical protein